MKIIAEADGSVTLTNLRLYDDNYGAVQKVIGGTKGNYKIGNTAYEGDIIFVETVNKEWFVVTQENYALSTNLKRISNLPFLKYSTVGLVTKEITKQRLPNKFVNALKSFGKTEVEILEYFTTYHNVRSGQKFFNDIEKFFETTNIYGLTRDEAFVVWGYTTNFFYRDLNAWLRNSENILQTSDLKSLINSGLNKLPNYTGQYVYRGISIESDKLNNFLAEYATGNIKPWGDFTSCGGSLEASFAGRSDINIIFQIKHTLAKDISDLADGIKYSIPPMPRPEILINAGGVFKSISQPSFNVQLQKWIIQVEQIQ